MSLEKTHGLKAGLIFIIHKFQSLQKQNKMAEHESGQQSHGGQGGQTSSRGESKGGSQKQGSRSSEKSPGKEGKNK